MLNKVKHFFDQHILPGAAAADPAHAVQVATAALLFEVMRTDGEFKDIERQAIRAAIHDQFALPPAQSAVLMQLAEREATQATDVFQFTRLIDGHFTAEQKERVVEQLWRVAFADHEIDRFERTLVHKVADLLHVPRAAQIAARDRVMHAGRATES